MLSAVGISGLLTHTLLQRVFTAVDSLMVNIKACTSQRAAVMLESGTRLPGQCRRDGIPAGGATNDVPPAAPGAIAQPLRKLR